MLGGMDPGFNAIGVGNDSPNLEEEGSGKRKGEE